MKQYLKILWKVALATLAAFSIVYYVAVVLTFLIYPLDVGANYFLIPIGIFMIILPISIIIYSNERN